MWGYGTIALVLFWRLVVDSSEIGLEQKGMVHKPLLLGLVCVHMTHRNGHQMDLTLYKKGREMLPAFQLHQWLPVLGMTHT